MAVFDLCIWKKNKSLNMVEEEFTNFSWLKIIVLGDKRHSAWVFTYVKYSILITVIEFILK